MNDQDFRFTQYEAWGEAKVRAMLDGGQLAASRADALLWLATRALEREEAAQTARVIESSRDRRLLSRQVDAAESQAASAADALSEAREANRIAHRANTIAIAAAIMAAVSIAFTIWRAFSQ